MFNVQNFLSGFNILSLLHALCLYWAEYFRKWQQTYCFQLIVTNKIDFRIFFQILVSYDFLLALYVYWTNLIFVNLDTSKKDVRINNLFIIITRIVNDFCAKCIVLQTWFCPLLRLSVELWLFVLILYTCCQTEIFFFVYAVTLLGWKG